MTRWHQAPEVLAAAVRWKERCLLRDGSVFTDRQLWTSENVDSLDRFFVQNRNFGDGDFYPKLKAQLAPAAASAKQLAAEMFWVVFLFISKKAMKGATKRLQIKDVWEWSGEPLPASSELGEVLDNGVGSTGQAYNQLRWREFVFFIDVMRTWKQLRTQDQVRLVEAPWDFAAWLDQVPSSKNRQFREILLYLLFPETFERMATARDKKSIIRSFLMKENKDPEAFNYDDRLLVDKEVKRIREMWSPKLGNAEFDFYRGDARVAWQRPAETGSADPPPEDGDDAAKEWFEANFGRHRVWIIAAGSGGRWWPDFRTQNIIAIGWDNLGDLSQFNSRDEIRNSMVEVGKLEHDPIHDSLAAWNFAHEMKPGDHVFAKAGLRTLLGHGIVTSEYLYQEERSEAQHVRKVEWRRIGRWDVAEKDRITGKTLTDFGENKAWLRMAWDTIYGKHKQADATEQTAYSLDDAIEDVFMSRESLQRIVDSLAAKKNVILEGAPGVGKTYVARRIAWALMRSQDSSRIEMVQFHQSYAYEDFVQGWRPDRKGFRLQNGVFHRFCDRARKDPEQPYVFIIDEINRGNLSKVLGELMMLIEADKRGKEFAIPLVYSVSDEDRFSVPGNVHILGLMNTADRSLAMVDYALRRRFAFFRLEPAFDSETFAEVLTKRGVPEDLIGRIRKAMTALNKEISDDRNALGPGYEIGHSFFVPSDGTDKPDENWYNSVIRGEIEPLLREYWFDQPGRVTSAVKALLA